jgi:hypothetical protein
MSQLHILVALPGTVLHIKQEEILSLNDGRNSRQAYEAGESFRQG